MTSKNILWTLGTGYGGRDLYPKQAFFPMAGEKDGWSRLARGLWVEVDKDLIEAYHGVKSLPFGAGQHRRVAVKIVDGPGGGKPQSNHHLRCKSC